MLTIWRQRVSLLLLILVTYHPSSVNGELISTLFAGGTALLGGGAAYFYTSLHCRYYECCNDDWIKADFDALRSAIRNEVYGQPLVESTVVNSLKRHFHKEARPSKALVMSFHGSTGSGKNFVSNKIADTVYKRGTKSKFFHLFVSTSAFPLLSHVEQYKTQLQNWISGNITQCPRSIFVFDEVDKMHGEVLEAITPFLGYYEQLDGIDYRKAVFIFLSNSGGEDINAKTLAAYQEGTAREKLKMVEFEKVIARAAYNEKGGLQYSSLLSNHLIDHQVAFLPLTREHVKRCVGDYMKQRYGAFSRYDTEENRINVADRLQYYPPDLQLYSVSGCKRVQQKVEVLIQEIEDGEDEFWE